MADDYGQGDSDEKQSKEEREARREAKAQQLAKISGFFDLKTEAIAQVLRAEIEPKQFISVVKSALSRNQDLLNCVPMTLYGAVYDAAKLGLDIDPRTGEFWLIPRKNRDMGGQLECTGMIGYKGFIALAKRTGVVERIVSRVVYSDEVELGLVAIDLGSEGASVKHEFKFTEDINRDDDQIVGAYCAAWLPGIDAPIIEPLTRKEIEKRRKSSATSMRAGRPWHDWYPEMCRKSTVRALFGRGYFPLTAKLHQPRKITIETPHLSLADALDADDRWADQRKMMPAPTDVESIEVPDSEESPTVPAGQVFEEENTK